MMSPRRSSRARSLQQPPSGPNHSNSSSSNNGKADRDARSINAMNSPRRPSTQRSESLDTVDPGSRAEQTAPRRSRRNGEEKEPTTNPQVDAYEDNDVDPTEEEVTRCICGQAEYPGPSATIRQQAPNADALTEDTGNFFVQCDSCSVWQHGGCMGLLAEALLPDEYYCELCKPEFHKITKNANGLRSSHYVPILEPTSTRSSPPSATQVPSLRKDNKKQLAENTKRRATMNSRSTFDEDAMLIKVIEDSRAIARVAHAFADMDHAMNPHLHPKRSLEDWHDDSTRLMKRPRTGSKSPSTVSKHSESPEPALDDASNKDSASHHTSNQSSRRAGPTRTNRDKEMRDKQKEQQAAQRAEAASKRKARSERRRGDESPPPSPSVSPSKGTHANGKPKADTPPSRQSTNNRKTGRPPARRVRLARNQYTRDTANGDDGSTPSRDVGHDANGHGTSPNAANGINGESGRSSKVKTHPARTSLNEMKRRVAAILEFVGHMQTERGAQSHHSSGSASSKGANTPNGAKGPTLHLPTATLVRAVEAGLKESRSNEEDGLVHLTNEREFATMGSIEMMETLTKELVLWQTSYGTYSR